MLGARAASRQKRNSFTSNWDTTSGISDNDSVTLYTGVTNFGPLSSSGYYNFKVYWGDGTSDVITTYNQAETLHQYASTGIYEIRMGGDISGWSISGIGGDAGASINTISNWGPLTINSASCFIADNFKLTATDAPILTTNTLYRMFESCDQLGDEGNMNSWDTSSVTNMSSMFNQATFNIPIGNWDTSSVTGMLDMFFQCLDFNQPIGNWNTSNVTDMYRMFYRSKFNQDIGNWDVSNVITMESMFEGLFPPSNTPFNNGDSSEISGWNTSKVQNMYGMFSLCVFNQPIGSWDTSSVTNINSMFIFNNAFDQDLSNWTVTGVTDAVNFMAFASGLSTENYDRTLSGWAQQSGDLQSGVSIHFGSSTYSVATGEQYRDILTGVGWTITDGGSV